MLRALGLGDFLTAVPALRAVRRALPEHRLVLAAPAVLEPLTTLVDAVDGLLPAQELRPMNWPGAPPDVAVNLHGRGPQSTRLLQALAARRLVAFGDDTASVSGPAWRPDEHEVVRWCRLVNEGLGGSADPGELALAVPPEPSPAPGAVVVHPGAASRSRQWPVARFAAVARAAADRGERVVVTGSSRERLITSELCRRAELSPEGDLAGDTSLREVAALVADARLVVCGDTGMAHLASAYGTPSVVLFGPVPPTLWGPPASGPHRVLARGDHAGDPHADFVDPDLLAITVEEVVAAMTDQLAAPAARR